MELGNISDSGRWRFVGRHQGHKNRAATPGACGVTTRRVLPDNGTAYRSPAWRDACTELGIEPTRTRPYRPQTNSRIERFHRTMATAGPSPACSSSSQPADTEIGNRPPITRSANLGGQYD